MSDEIQLPCETCITRPVCKYKKEIQCSLLLEVYDDILGLRANRILEEALCELFDWAYNHTIVIQCDGYIIVRDTSFSDLPRIKR